MKNEKRDARRKCLERLIASARKESISKAIVIENNQIYTYGYDRVHKA